MSVEKFIPPKQNSATFIILMCPVHDVNHLISVTESQLIYPNELEIP